jgi:leucyl aminopeptidase (aminopeptidase T)
VIEEDIGMKEILAMKGAKVIVEHCACIQKGEKVLIVTDFEAVSSAQILAGVTYTMGAEVEICVMVPRELDGQEPTVCVAAAMKKAEVILMPVTKSISHTEAIKGALTEGARVLSLTASSEELMASEAYKADFKKQRPVCEKVAQLFTQTKEVTITTPMGTNLVTSAKGRKGNAHSCIVDRPGQFSAAPNIEANFSPVEGTMEGIFVADASIPYLGIGLLSTPVTFTIKEGKVVEVEGGNEAERLKNIWAEQKDPNVYNIAQVAVGLNPEIKAPLGRLGCNYDEGSFGTAHIGIGTSSILGGEVKASTHFDAVMTEPTIKLDGKQLLKDGVLLL